MRVNQSGFTLLELLVALFIIGILISLAVLSVDRSAATDALEHEAARLTSVLGLASDKAILDAAEYGLQFSERGYQFFALERNGWEPVADQSPLRRYELPAGLDLSLRIGDEAISLPASADPSRGAPAGDDPDEKKKTVPHVLMLSEGETTEFELTIEAQGLATAVQVVAQENDGLIVKQVDAR